MKYLIDAVLKIAKKNPEGFTIELTTLKNVKSGFSVAYKETQDCFGRQGLEKVIKHAENHNKVIGGWYNEDNGKFYFDSIKILNKKEEAIQFGIDNEQIAIFDLDNLQVIKL